MLANVPTRKPKIAISACLMGDEVRYNGGHKQSRYCRNLLSDHFQFVKVCPEMAIGLGVPRQPIRLVGDPESPKARGTVDKSVEVTQALADYGKEMADTLGDISGYIFMQKSPSCGVERVKVYREDGIPQMEGGSGVYAKAFCEARPDLPVEEEGRLCDPVLRENFVTRVYAYADWQALKVNGLSRRAITEFHARYKYQLMACNPEQYKVLGALLGSSGQRPLEEVAEEYFHGLMQGLRRCATRGNHANVLMHISGYLRRHMDPQDKAEIRDLILQYRDGTVPLVVPLTLLKHLFRLHPDPYIAQQVYLQPHPEKLSLRNAI
ncbi:2-thiouracil desulfurase family protein [Pseudomonas sp. KNUC1026]|uniref:2-thiouracil desulfurase family protein n=1 Tax=Pseudomonas sp. KNUC1026 TaxID=2893890 RepID=UPI001F270B61|nr:2-thiouracil desulfurase family protein [Pseudomonas sp. KNUC1026]UFH48659.1 DUF1722 domain-containing protein [Pseudomonas sp. KNUC1026]